MEASIAHPCAITREALHALLAQLEIPRDFAAVLGIWACPGGEVEVHLSPGAFWRVVKRASPAVTSTEQPDLLFPHRHAFTRDGVEFFTFSVEPILPPGVLTPGYAVRLT